ncbi:MAG: SMP-30/gluconolactonase/LRE family protein [Verrucomicrobiales bacterium]|nr:SMP-30/gluconolactonase/LRE family protein [Verrucomicrobiales bacterium]
MIRLLTTLLTLATSLHAAGLPFERFQLDGQNAFVILPEKSDSTTKPTPWVLYAPTFHKKLPNHRDEGWMIDRFLAQGIAIAGIDVGESYGSPTGRDHYTALHNHLVTTKNFDPKACLLARSRGGLMLYNWAADHPGKIRCIAGIYPVCDPTSYPGLEKAAPAYGTDAPGLRQSLELHNPTHPSRLEGLAEHRVPVYHIHGDIDKVVPLKENSQALTTNLRQLGGSATLNIPTGQGHNMWPGFFEHQPLVDFIIANATAPHLDAEPELLWSGAVFTEGPAAHPTDGTLIFSDVRATTLYHFDPTTGATTKRRHPSGRANGNLYLDDGSLITCEGAAPGGNRRISVTHPNKPPQTLTDNWQGKRFNSPNDIASAPDGSLYFTDPRYAGDEPRDLDFEGVFRIAPDHTVTLATRETTKPNGIVISHDGTTAYVAENNPSGDRHLLAFTIQPDGRFTGKRVLHDFGTGRGIDGMAIDPGGVIYATAGSGEKSGIYIFNPAGALLNTIKLPGPPTNSTLGTGDNSHILYVTAAAPDNTSYGLYQIDLTP